jgi:hypothetical protein
MNSELVQNLRYSYADEAKNYPLALPLRDSLQLISDFFKNNSTNKLCLVFPSKEYAAQWLSTPTVLFLIESDFTSFKNEIAESYKKYNRGDKLILNNDAVVEWVGKSSAGYVFRHKEYKGVDKITIGLKNISKLQPAPSNRQSLSTHKRLISAIHSNSSAPIDSLLGIKTEGNKLFQRNKVCLVSKFKSYNESIADILLNNSEIADYFSQGKIDENGLLDVNTPFIISNNLSNLALYITISDTVSKIIIDGYSSILERGTDFSDIDVKNIPTILITDLSEIASFENIGNYGFEFFNFTKENLNLELPEDNTPFYSLQNKLTKYKSFSVIKEISENATLEAIVQKLYLIEKDDSNNDLNSLKIGLIQLTNLISRIAHLPSGKELSGINSKIESIEALFFKSKMWLGDSFKPIEDAISDIKLLIAKFSSTLSEKGIKLQSLLGEKQYDYIICCTEDEVQSLFTFLSQSSLINVPEIISVADVNDSILTSGHLKGLLIGWPKSNNINRILASFLFSELTLLFYQFENGYFNSLQIRNRKFNENIRPTINSNGIRATNGSNSSWGFDAFYSNNETIVSPAVNSIDILDFELKLELAQFAKYTAKGNLIESIKAKRVEFENASFMYSTESHKFLIINELIEKSTKKPSLHKKRIDGLKVGDVVALINTDRDILADLVEKNTNTKELKAVKQWTELWKNLLKDYYSSIGCDFKKLVAELRKYDCKKHEVTIRTWLQDENRIGPDDDADLISIALLTDSNHLNENIKTVRESIKKMTGWRMKASDFITDKIKSKIYEFADSSIINIKIPVEGLGNIVVLKVCEVSYTWDHVDVRYANKLLQKEII